MACQTQKFIDRKIDGEEVIIKDRNAKIKNCLKWDWLNKIIEVKVNNYGMFILCSNNFS